MVGLNGVSYAHATEVLEMVDSLTRADHSDVGYNRHSKLLPALVLTLGLITTAGLAELTRRQGVVLHDSNETSLRKAIAASLQAQVTASISTLSGVSSWLYQSSSITPARFDRFVVAQKLSLPQSSAVEAIGFIPWVRPDQAAVHNPSSEAEILVSPHDPLEARLGFGRNLLQNREAMQQALSSGLPTLTAPVLPRIETVSNGNHPYVNLLVPIGQTASHEAAGSHPQPLGWAVAALNPEDMIRSAMASVDNPKMAGADVVLFDGAKPQRANLLVDTQKLLQRGELSHPNYQTLAIAGRTWLLGVQCPNPLAPPHGRTVQFWMTLVVGSSASVIAALLMGSIVRNQRALVGAYERNELERRELAIAATVFEGCGEGIVVTNAAGIILKANSAFCTASGYCLPELRGHHISLLNSDQQDASDYDTIWQAATTDGFWQGEAWTKTGAAATRCFQLTVTAVRDDQLEAIHVVSISSDITKRKKMEHRLRRRANHDQLTGLANRAVLMERLSRDLALARRHGHALGLLFIDLDGFKAVNDRLGHHAGDRVLTGIAKRFSAIVRASDLLCRLGGDEFVVLVPLVDESTDLEALAWKLVECSREPLTGLDLVVRVSACVGIAQFPIHGSSAEQLLWAADQAMYCAKQRRDQPVQVATSSADSEFNQPFSA